MIIAPLPSSRRAGRPGESGAVLITVMMVMLALLGLGVMALWMTSGNLQIGANTNLRNQALYVAEAGIEAVRNDLNRLPARNPNPLLARIDPANDNKPPRLSAPRTPHGLRPLYFT